MWPTPYARFSILLVRGKGTRVWDLDGKEYLDFVSGLAVCNLGHCHPQSRQGHSRSSEKLIHVSNFYYIEPQIQLASLLCKHSFADKVFFCNSGAEANEGAMKLARKLRQGRRWEKTDTKSSPWSGLSRKDFWQTLTATARRSFIKGMTSDARIQVCPF